MAWTDACKIEAVAQIDHKVEQGKSVRKALKELSEESGIPAGTIRRWKYPESSVPKNGNTKKEPKPFDAFEARGKLRDIIRRELRTFKEHHENTLQSALWDIYQILVDEYDFKGGVE